MGLFSKAKAALGIEDSALIRNGTLALGNVKKVEPTGMGVGSDNSASGMAIVCKVTVEVVPLDGSEAYLAECTHAIPRINLPQMQQEGAQVAIRVDPADPHHIELDLTHAVPPAPIVLVGDDGTQTTVETHDAPKSSADILRDGAPCEIEVLAVFPLNQNDKLGRPASGLVVNVHRDGVEPYQAQIGFYIPEDKAAKVVVGATLPAKFLLPTGPDSEVNLVTPDWDKI